MTETFRTDAILNQEYHRLFRVIPGTNIHSISYHDDPMCAVLNILEGSKWDYTYINLTKTRSKES